MIDFACKKFNLEEVIRCSLVLTKTEFKIIKYLMTIKKKLNSQEISNKLNIGLSTSQRAIKRINDKGLIIKSQRNLKKGGYVFVYSIKEKAIFKEKTLEIIHNWVAKVEKEIKRW